MFLAARDRYGIKPLFWTLLPHGVDGERRLVVSAEAKGLLPMGWEPEWDVRAIVDAGWGHDTRTLFKGVQKVCNSFSLFNCPRSGTWQPRAWVGREKGADVALCSCDQATI